LTVARSLFVADLGGTKLTCAVVDGAGKILARHTERVDTSTTLAPVNQICQTAAVLAPSKGPRRQSSWAAAGVAVPGLVRRTGTVWAPNLAGWDHVPLGRLLGKRLRIPVVVESDRNAAVLGEAWQGAGRRKTDVIALVVGTGIGAGILSGGQLIRGAHELSGCAGWMAIAEGETEISRRVGSLEALAAGPAIAKAASRLAMLTPKARTASGRSRKLLVSALDVAEAARRGNRQAKQIFHRAAHILGLAVANLISMFDPEVVVIGGGLAGASDLFFDTLRRTALEHCQPLAARRVRICVSQLGPDANLLGAARLALLASGGSE